MDDMKLVEKSKIAHIVGDKRQLIDDGDGCDLTI
jgi:hypothetical protein